MKKANPLMAAVVGAMEPETAPPLAVPVPERKQQSRASREGKHLIAGHFSPKVVTALKIIAAEERTTQQQLLEEALTLLFVKKGKGNLFNG